MKDFLKTLINGLAGVIATALIAIWWQSASKTQDINIEYSEIQLGLDDLDSLSDDRMEEAQKVLKDALGREISYRDFLGLLLSSKLFRISVANSSDARTKEIEFSAEFAEFGLLTGKGQKETLFDLSDGKTFTLTPINPGGEVTLFVVSEGLLYLTPRFQFLHEERLIPVESLALNTSGSPFGLIRWINRNVEGRVVIFDELRI